jgi:hypothetical protein
VVLGWVCAAAAASANSGLPARATDYAVFGLKDVRLGTGARVQVGDVGVNQPLGRVWLKLRARVAGMVIAETVRLGHGARVGRLVAGRLEGGHSFERLDSALPLIPVLPLVQVVPGNQDKELPQKSVELGLPQGAYGRIRVGSRSRLTLAGGQYDVLAIVVRRNGQLLCEAPCTINVDDRAVFNDGARLGAVEPLDATAVRVNVEGGSGNRALFRAEAQSTVDATVYAPTGHIHLGVGGNFTGAFVGESVEILRRARVKAMPAPGP